MEEIAMLRAETDRLDALLATLDAEGWSTPSACAGWDVADVVLHLAQSEESVVATIEEGDSTLPFARHARDATSVDEVMQAAVEAERGPDGPTVRRRWRAAHERALTLLAQADPGQRLAWAAAPLRPRTLTVTRLSEHWIHSLDIHTPLGVALPDTARLWPIARLAHRTLPYAFSQADAGPAPPTRLELQAPDGDQWVFGPDDAEAVIAGPAGQLCRVAARRLDPAHADLVTTGRGAAQVLALIRTYA